MSPEIKIARQIINQGRITESNLPSHKVNKIKKYLTDNGIKCGLTLTKPKNYFTGIISGSSFYLWCILPNKQLN